MSKSVDVILIFFLGPPVKLPKLSEPPHSLNFSGGPVTCMLDRHFEKAV